MIEQQLISVKNKVLYIRSGAFTPYKKGVEHKTAQDYANAGKKLARKAIIDSLVKAELPKVLQEALPEAIAKYRAHLAKSGRSGISNAIAIVPINSWEAKECYSADTFTFGNEWDNTGVHIVHNGSNVDIMVPIVSNSFGLSMPGIKLVLSSEHSCNYSNLLSFRTILASSMAPEIDELEASMAAAGLKLDIKYYLAKAYGDSDWAHVDEVAEVAVNADEPFVEEQKAYNQENMQHDSNEPFSAFIRRQKHNGYGVMTELIEPVKVSAISWDTAAQSLEMPMQCIISELAALCKEFRPATVKLVARASDGPGESLDSIAPLVQAMAPNSKISMSFVRKYGLEQFQQSYSDLEPGSMLMSSKLCKELFGMPYEEALNRLVYEAGAKDIERDEAAGKICKRACITGVEIELGSSIENSRMSVSVVKLLADALDKRENPKLMACHASYELN